MRHATTLVAALVVVLLLGAAPAMAGGPNGPNGPNGTGDCNPICNFFNYLWLWGGQHITDGQQNGVDLDATPPPDGGNSYAYQINKKANIKNQNQWRHSNNEGDGSGDQLHLRLRDGSCLE